MSSRRVIQYLLGTAVLILPLILVPSSFAETKVNPFSLAGKWGCLSQGAFGNETKSIATHSIAQIVQVTLGSKNNVMSGGVFLHNGSEACLFEITGGTYKIDTTRSGKLAIELAIPSPDLDEDGDSACSDLLGLPSGASSVTENFDIVVVSNKRQINLVGADDFLTGSAVTDDSVGDFISLAGQCLPQ